MGGEMQSEPSGWSVDTLKQHFDGVFRDLDTHSREQDRRYQERFVAQQTALHDALTAAEKAVDAALASAKEAVIKAETATEKRFAGVNEFRDALNDATANNITRAEAEASFNAIRLLIASSQENSVAATQRVAERISAQETYGAKQATTIAGIPRMAEQLTALENFRSRATGVAVVLVLFAGLIGAAVSRALGG